jgi:hypothetical protein
MSLKNMLTVQIAQVGTNLKQPPSIKPASQAIKILKLEEYLVYFTIQG